MSTKDENLVPIPAEWRSQVVRILRSGDKGRIQSTAVSVSDWSATFPAAWDYQRLEALASALSVDGITGKQIGNMVPKCDAYEFFFSFDGRKLYGKIGLLPDGTVIIIFSTHIPRRGDKL